MRTIGALASVACYILLTILSRFIMCGHTRSTSPASLAKTDWLASALPQRSGSFFRRHVPPIFMMDCFTPFHSSPGSIEANFSRLIPNLLALSLIQDPEFYPSHLFPHFLHALIRHRPTFICMPHLRFRQQSSFTFVLRSLTLQMYVTGGLGHRPLRSSGVRCH